MAQWISRLNLSLIEALTRKGNCPPRHIHRNEDESFYILEGEITALIGDQTIRGTPGTLIFGPRGVPHSFEIHSDQVRMPILLTPAGLEGYFKQFCTPAPALILPPPCRSSIRGRYKPKFCGRFYLQRSR